MRYKSSLHLLTYLQNTAGQKMAYVKQVFTESSVIDAVLILRGKINGVITRDRPRRNWIDDIKELTNVKDCTVSLREMQKKGLLEELGTCIFYAALSSRPVHRKCAQVAPSGECLRGYKPGAVVSSHSAPRVAASCLC